MSRTVTIVMYHYIRDLERSRFPAIKGLSVERFCRQLDYIQAHFTIIAVENLMEAMANSEMELPPNQHIGCRFTRSRSSPSARMETLRQGTS